MSHKEALTLARQLLWRYRHETPVGNQPHMICQEVDEAFERIDEALAQPELCKYGQEPKSCTSSPMDCQCALDATFAQPEQEEKLPPVEIGVDVTKEGTAVTAFYRRANDVMEIFYSQFHPLAQPEQEPVAWMIWTHGPVLVFMKKDEADMEFDRLNQAYPEPTRMLIPLYTTPPKRTWVGLTDEDIGRCFDSADGTMGSLIAAIEAKIKEKNT